MAEAAAPGKLLLTGEYAVLDGAPGVSLALGVTARARAAPAAEARLLERPGSAGWPFRLQADGRVHWRGAAPAETVALPTAVLGTMLQRWPALADGPPLELRLDTTAFQRAEPTGPSRKLGLGSSAALTVALAAAVLRAAELAAAPADFQQLCLDAHRAFQHGRGSGVDVLTALHGGLLICRHAAAGPVAETIPWPGALQLVIVWSGRPASTPALVGRYQAFRERQPVECRPYRLQLAAAAEDAAAAWRDGDVAAVLAGVRHYALCLRELDAASGIGIWTAEHRALAALADSVGAVYKPSGAGGGDLGFALTAEPEVAAALRLHFGQRELLVLDLPLAVTGLRITDA